MSRFYSFIILIAGIGCLLAISTCQAQIIEFNYGPHSNRGIGDLPNTSRYGISLLFKAYQSPGFDYVPGIRYTHVHSKNKEILDKTRTRVNGKFSLVFLIPLSFNIPILNGKVDVLTRFGYGYSIKRFPNKNGTHGNFLLETGLMYPITSFFSFSLRYSHISNGGMGTINPGVDNVEIAASFSF